MKDIKMKLQKKKKNGETESQLNKTCQQMMFPFMGLGYGYI